jgi:hypothetical protein
MKKLIILLLTINLYAYTMAQADTTILAGTGPTDSSIVKKPYQAWVKTEDGKMTKGWLYETRDDEVVLLNERKTNIKNWPAMSVSPGNIINIPTAQIQTIIVRKKNSKLKGTLLGLGIGVVTGVAAGFISGDDPVEPYTNTFADVFIAVGNAFTMTAAEKALVGAIALGTAGTIVGYVISSIVKKKFVIGGKKQKVRDLHAELVRKQIIPQ